MTDGLPIVLLHGSATGSHSWAAVRTGLEAYGAAVVAPDMVGYGRSPTSGEAWQPKDEVAHLRGWLDMQGVGAFHLVTHSIGAFFGLHLRLAVGSRVARLTLVDPVVVSVLRVTPCARCRPSTIVSCARGRITVRPPACWWSTGAAPARGTRWARRGVRWLQGLHRGCGSR